MKKLDGAYVTSIRSSKRVGDATVHNLRALKYHSGEISYKLSHNESWKVLPQRVTVPNEPFNWFHYSPSSYQYQEENLTIYKL